MEIINIKELSYSYKNNSKALENINLSIQDDDFLAIIGPNGGGKSTLLKLILGLLKPQSGKILGFERWKMNRCKKYLIKCPWALKLWDESPCIGTEAKCDRWRKTYKQESPSECKKIIKINNSDLPYDKKVKLLEKQL